MVHRVDVIIDDNFEDNVEHFYISYDKNSENELIKILNLFKKRRFMLY